MSNWWITTGPLPGGEKIDGPYLSFDEAVEARRGIEAVRAPETFWIDTDDRA
jgi:hypothetical protein